MYHTFREYLDNKFGLTTEDTRAPGSLLSAMAQCEAEGHIDLSKLYGVAYLLEQEVQKTYREEFEIVLPALKILAEAGIRMEADIHLAPQGYKKFPKTPISTGVSIINYAREHDQLKMVITNWGDSFRVTMIDLPKHLWRDLTASKR